jgi:hypothetical protein
MPSSRANYKSPLTIHVVWHPSFTEGEAVADYIYKHFARDISDPLTRAVGIPVYYRSVPPKGKKKPLPIPLDESDYNAIVVLVDDNLYNDDEWNGFVRELIKKISPQTRLFPVAFSPNAFYFEENTLGTQQYIDAKPKDTQYKEGEWDSRLKEIRSRLLHGLCRLLLNRRPVHEAVKEIDEPAPVRLFISHAKKDGETDAIRFRDYVRSVTKLNTFFDANDIADGYRFDTQITDAAGKEDTALVVFHTDMYVTREWCQIEVLTAKRHKSPIVVVHNITKGEKRSFPYLGNVPTIRFFGDNFDDIIDLALYQVLINVFNRRNLERISRLYKPAGFATISFSSPPELFNLPDIIQAKEKMKNEKLLVLYPDPPIGSNELRVLDDMKTDVRFLTPIQLSTLL